FNGIMASMQPDIIKAVSEDPQVGMIFLDGEPMIPVSDIRGLRQPPYTAPQSDTSWASKQVRALEVWQLGYRGQGVVVGMVDTGVNYNHMDLENRLWHNEGEIPNNGIDDDGNGYIDDYIGFNFKDLNGDPMDYDGHGTWTASIVVGDGTAGKLTGVAPEARIICCKWGSSMGTVWLAFQYCADNGADIVSASVGYLHGSGSVVARSICDYLLSLGVVLSAAAGNGAHNNGDHEPAPYDIVSPGVVPSPWSSPNGKSATITVGATRPGDGIAGFSSWGPTVWDFSPPNDDYPYPPGLMKPDVCAPGVAVPGASYSSINGYVVADGTSGATPCNAGVIALMLSADSLLSPVEIDSILETTAVELGPPGKDSLYGAGRVDALMAIASSRMSWLTKTSDYILDGGTGDGDGRPEAGETDSLVVAYRNDPLWRDASDVSLRLVCADTGISIVQEVSNLGPVPAGDSATNVSNPFVLDVSPAFEPREVDFEIRISATPASLDTADTITLMVGHPSVLLVDDDGGADALDEISVVYDDWNVNTMGNAGSALEDYCLVIWFTGDMAESTLTEQERSSLQSYLDGGGLLFLTGQNIGQDINADPFYSDYLHATFVQATTNDHILDGVSGDEIGDGYRLLTTGSPGAGNQTSQDVIAPLAGADSIIMYGPGDCAAIKYDSGTYKVVYFGFGFEGIASRPAQGFDLNWHVMRSVIKWLGCPQVGIEEGPEVRGAAPGTRLFQNTPNPFSTSTTIRFILGGDVRTERVTLGVYDAAGRLVGTLIDGGPERAACTSFDASTLPSGVYFYRLQAGSVNLCRKMIVVK
ncbi:MAG: S8 family peptidase, partial [bacterium]